MKELNSDKLKQLRGGVTQVEYCETLCMLIENNYNTLWDPAQQESAIDAWYANCLNSGVDCVVSI